METDRTIAWNILEALCESSIKDEFLHYSSVVQADLKLSDEQMGRLYNMRTISRLLQPTPVPLRYYRGVLVQGSEYEKKAVPEVPSNVVPSDVVPTAQQLSEKLVETFTKHREDDVKNVEQIIGMFTKPCEASPKDSQREEVSRPIGAQQLEERIEKHLATRHPIVDQKDLPVYGVESTLPVDLRTPAEITEAMSRPFGEKSDRPLPDFLTQQPSSEQPADAHLVIDVPAEVQPTPVKNMHPAAKALRKMLRALGIKITADVVIDTDKYFNAVILTGVSKEEDLTQIGGKYNEKGFWRFTKRQLENALRSATEPTDSSA
jgi:hypothetical protein